MTGHVCVRTRYYKAGPALAILDHAHALRNGFTRSQNVITAISHNNAGTYFSGTTSSLEAFEIMCERYKETTGKKCRSDFNALFEHILIFSENVYTDLEQKHGSERLKRSLLLQLKKYAEKIKKEFGFEPLGIDLHLDEGLIDQQTGKVRRNIHAHIQFFNYDFDKRVAPLRHLMRKGVDENGRTQQLNPNFVLMQDIAGNLFSKAGFKRGESKDVTGREHLKKEGFVKQELKLREEEVNRLKRLANDLSVAIKQKARAALMKITQTNNQSIKLQRTRML
tara:strand:- start:3237 stop:4076 length:840 start_codon:yes stop_codon:yes gene_type:complete